VDTGPFSGKGVHTPQRHTPAYPKEFRERLVELVHSGRTPKDLAREFEPSAQTIRNWVARADRDAGKRSDGLTTAEREELRRLRRENKQLKIEKEILKKPPPGSRRRPIRFRPRVQIRESASG
jgi:transposase